MCKSHILCETVQVIELILFFHLQTGKICFHHSPSTQEHHGKIMCKTFRQDLFKVCMKYRKLSERTKTPVNTSIGC